MGADALDPQIEVGALIERGLEAHLEPTVRGKHPPRLHVVLTIQMPRHFAQLMGAAIDDYDVFAAHGCIAEAIAKVHADDAAVHTSRHCTPAPKYLIRPDTAS